MITHSRERGELTLYDAAPEPLAKVAARLAEVGRAADSEIRDAWAEPDRSIDSLFMGFSISYIDRARSDEFFGLAMRWLAPGGLFAFIDSRQDPASGARDRLPSEDDVQVRRLAAARSFASARADRCVVRPPLLGPAPGPGASGDCA